VPILTKIGQEMRPWECPQIHRQTDWQTQMDFIISPMPYAIAMGQIIIIIIIITARTMFMLLSSWHSHYCESSPSSFDECRLSAGWPPTLRPNQPIWAVSPPKDWLLSSADTIAIYYYYSARKLILILPSNGGWKAEST